MRILILSNEYSCSGFFNLFASNEDNIVFSLIEGCNKVDLITNQDVIDFVEGNLIDFIIVKDEKYINDELFEQLNKYDINIFSPSEAAVKITKSKASAKKFMHKNKLTTPRFQIFDKIQPALDYLKSNTGPVSIKPDIHNYFQRVVFCETKTQYKNTVKDFFENDCKRIIVEDYIEGKNICAWTLSNGYSAKILGTCAKYYDNVSYFEPEFIDKKIKNEMSDKFINPTINALSYEDNEYIGILGFDFILDRNNNLNLIGYKGFFDDIDVDFFTKGFDVDWLNIFKSTITGDVFLKYEIKPKNDYMLTLRQNDGIKFLSAKTLSNLEIYIDELNLDNKEYEEAKKVWKQ